MGAAEDAEDSAEDKGEAGAVFERECAAGVHERRILSMCILERVLREARWSGSFTRLYSSGTVAWAGVIRVGSFVWSRFYSPLRAEAVGETGLVGSVGACDADKLFWCVSS